MKKYLLIILSLFICFPICTNAYTYNLNWEIKEKDQSNNHYINIIQIDSGNIIALFDSSNKDYSSDDYQAFIKYDKNGQKIWSKKLEKNISNSNIISNNNGFISIGSETINENKKGSITSYDQDGNQQWKQTYNSDEYSEFNFVIEKNDNYTILGKTDQNGILAKYTKTGDFVSSLNFSLDYDSSGLEWKNYSFKNFKLLSDNSYIIIGTRSRRSDEEPLYDNFVVKYSKNGTVEWSKNISSHSDINTYKDMTVDSNDNITFIIYDTQNDTGYSIKKYDKNGNIVKQTNPQTAIQYNRIYYNKNKLIVSVNTNGKSYIYLYDENLNKENEIPINIEDRKDKSIKQIIYNPENKKILVTAYNYYEQSAILLQLNPKFEISPKKSTNGSFTSIQKDDLCVITTVPNKGYQVSNVTVKDINGNNIETNNTKENEYTFKIKEDLTIDVEFEKAIANPNTKTEAYSSFIMITLSISILYCLLYKKLN